MVKNQSACNAGDLDSIPELERSPGEGNGNPLQYSRLENSRDRGDWQLQPMALQTVRHNGATNTISERAERQSLQGLW